jgi:hypothetical protein
MASQVSAQTREYWKDELLKSDHFKTIYERLCEPEDIKALHDETGLDEELLSVIYSQRTVREATKNFYRVQRNVNRLLYEWQRGTPLIQVARNWRFPPILTGLMIFQASGKSKKQFWSYVREPQNIADEGLRRQIIDITEADMCYSPWANEVQCKRGRWGEEKLQTWLNEMGVTYRTEKDLRGEFPKTPDALLDKPITVNGWRCNWIESKATFGDRVEVNKNVKKQLEPYTHLFGQGLVVYWYGFVDEVVTPPGIFITDSSLSCMTCKIHDQ